MGLLQHTAAATVILAAGTAAAEPEGDINTRIGECAIQAVQQIEIPEYGIFGTNTVHTRSFHDDGTLERQTAERITTDIYRQDGHSDQNSIFINITSDDPGSVLIYSEHEGTNGPITDAARTKIGLEFDGTSVTKRTAGAASDAFGVGVTETIHGQWTIAAAQTAEAAFTECMGLDNPQRIEGAATEVDAAPPLYEYTVPEQ